MALREAALSDGSDLVAEEMRFELGWNSTSTTIVSLVDFLTAYKMMSLPSILA